MLCESARKSVLEAAQKMERLGLVKGASGNISERDPETGLVAITPSGIAYAELGADQICVVDIRGKRIESRSAPSSETPMHLAVYRARQDISAIVHTHSPYATAFGLDGRELPAITVPSAAFAPVKNTGFFAPGSIELAEAVVNSLGETENALLLQNHGGLTASTTAASALEAAVYLEEAAQVGLYALSAGIALVRIPERTVRELRERYKKGIAL